MRIVGGPHVMPAAMFLGSFSWSFVDVSLPFHIQRIMGIACLPLVTSR